MYCIIKCNVQGKQARVKNANLRHPSSVCYVYFTEAYLYESPFGLYILPFFLWFSQAPSSALCNDMSTVEGSPYQVFPKMNCSSYLT